MIFSYASLTSTLLSIVWVNQFNAANRKPLSSSLGAELVLFELLVFEVLVGSSELEGGSIHHSSGDMRLSVWSESAKTFWSQRGYMFVRESLCDKQYSEVFLFFKSHDEHTAQIHQSLSLSEKCPSLLSQ